MKVKAHSIAPEAGIVPILCQQNYLTSNSHNMYTDLFQLYTQCKITVCVDLYDAL